MIFREKDITMLPSDKKGISKIKYEIRVKF
jgi:hypothetical protein